MLELASRPRIGPYILTRDLGPSALGERQLALHEGDYSSHVLHRLRPPVESDDCPAHACLAACQAASTVRHAHALPIELIGEEDQTAWLITPYTGDVDGLVTLAALLRAKGGYLSSVESRQAVVQLLDLAMFCHASGTVHGPLSMDEILVDRRGSLLVELYGLRRALGPAGDPEHDAREEVRSIVRIGYQILTGLMPVSPIIPAGRVVSGLDPVWDDWFETGLISAEAGGPGFKSAAHAFNAIASPMLRPTAAPHSSTVRTVLKRLLAGRR